jgi:hypothetical protein
VRTFSFEMLTKWTDEIHDEWIRNVLADRPDLKPEHLCHFNHSLAKNQP